MPSYKLHYFNSRGFGEQIRVLFALAGVEYEDIRYTQEEWPAVKATGKFPFGTVPCLEVDGVMLAQSNAIARYLANEYGFAGKNNLEKAKVDMIVDAFGDLFKMAIKWYYAADEDAKAAAIEEFKTKTCPAIYGGLEKILVANNGGDGYYVGNEVTLADTTLIMAEDITKRMNPQVLDNYPKQKALTERVLALPKIADWIRKRPQTDH
ncbi:hematopoietic prostaglandin D synthase-like [Saccoglossus kowalevskii]|uniref:Hematopoietic prostaglandin D synthase-like n=1 Tax=Saccoglossus kowalevskii TaxID=10224 RepID=A0ABM0LXC0_SACKO|nr:PREDICTED: hematopoietic prostaglandin D synthase-like [Saccoglossus kowalevskii]